MQSGIYIIYSNSNSSKFYIGSAVCLSMRYNRHLRELRKKKHFNRHLQSHVNKYGINDLIFQVIEYCEKDQLLIREQFYFNLLKPTFNINPTAASRAGAKHSNQTKTKIRRALAGKNPIPILVRYSKLMNL